MCKRMRKGKAPCCRCGRAETRGKHGRAACGGGRFRSRVAFGKPGLYLDGSFPKAKAIAGAPTPPSPFGPVASVVSAGCAAKQGSFFLGKEGTKIKGTKTEEIKAEGTKNEDMKSERQKFGKQSSTAGLGWAGLGWAGLGWAGLGWAGLGWAGLGWAGLGWANGLYVL